jgi:hypothetical protein
MEAMRDRVDLSMKTDTKEMRIDKPAFHLFTKEIKSIIAQILYM